VLFTQLLVTIFVNTPSCYVKKTRTTAMDTTCGSSPYLNVEARIVLLREAPAHRAIFMTPWASWLHWRTL